MSDRHQNIRIFRIHFRLDPQTQLLGAHLYRRFLLQSHQPSPLPRTLTLHSHSVPQHRAQE